MSMSWVSLMLPVVLIELLIGVAIIIGALKMMRLQSYGWATTAAILALLPCSPASLLSFAMGIWSLVVLNRRQVQEGFQAQARSRAALRSR
jgi:Na+-transporting NADH:ubiquinone oxidoreductase subunit NqrD